MPGPALQRRQRAGASVREALRERFAGDPVLLEQVRGRVALARAGPPRAADEAEADAFRQRVLEAVTDRAPRPHVLRLLLRPDDLLERGIAVRERGGGLDRERVELLDPGD